MIMFLRIILIMSSVSLWLTASAQHIIITGHVKDESNVSMSGVNVVIRDKVIGTTTDRNGNFRLVVKGTPPLHVVFSMLGFMPEDREINSDSIDLVVVLKELITTLDEVQVKAPSRVEEKIMRSPVSIEKMGTIEIRNVASDDFYKSLATKKGVELISSSINFQVVNARGFNRPNNSRFVQLFDGMDMQSPTMNYSFGSATLPSALDIDNMELLPGAASVMYGPNAYNGVLLVSGKSPFDYQGLSASVKLGFNHFGGDTDLGDPSSPRPMYEIAFRYAKAFNNKFAFKINCMWAQATDWVAHNYADKNEGTQGALDPNPGYDGVNLYGDDGGANLGMLRGSQSLINMLVAKTGLGADTIAPYVASLPATNVNRTGYPEYVLADYNSKNLKFNLGLNYRITDNLELSYFFNAAYMTTISTAAQRYAIKNAFNQFHRVELKGSNWNLMGYASFEYSGDSYIIDFTGYAINNANKSNSLWYGTYAGTLAGAMIQANITATGSPVYNPTVMNALLNNAAAMSNIHTASRNAADAGRWDPASAYFQNAMDSINSLSVPQGALFYDRSRFYHVEGQYDFRKEIRFVSLIIGANWRMYDLRSNGTVFDDSEDNPIRINEYGVFAEVSKNLFRKHLKLAVSLRFDKSENFEGRLTPRFSGVYTFLKNHNLRVSYQTGFRNPNTMDQYMDLDIVTSRVIGGLPEFYDKYRIGEWTYTLASVNDFSASVISGKPDPSKLVRYTTWEKIKPERIQVVEAGYRGMLFNKLLIDVYYYYNIYNDFITSTKVRQAQDSKGNPVDPFTDPTQAALYSLLSGGSKNTFQIACNNSETLKSEGLAVGVEYNIFKGYRTGVNYSWNHMITNDLADDYINNYNTPAHVVNVVFGNRNAYKDFGFNVAWRWQDAFTWNGSFARDGYMPAVNTIDAQISYTIRKLKTIIKVGGSDILNNRYVTFYGGPTIGGIYYISLTFDELIR